jgi:hypothetical protein
MGLTTCTEPQCLYKGALYLYLYKETAWNLPRNGADCKHINYEQFNRNCVNTERMEAASNLAGNGTHSVCKGFPYIFTINRRTGTNIKLSSTFNSRAISPSRQTHHNSPCPFPVCEYATSRETTNWFPRNLIPKTFSANLSWNFGFR